VAVLADIFDPFLGGVTQLIDPNVKQLEAELAAEFYGHPSKDLFLVGITGTNGKTITSYLVRHLLEQDGVQCGLMGTVEYIVGRSSYAATRTTPDVSTNHKLMREMLTQGCHAAVMEVTSHGLDQDRVAQLDFDVAIFTNLSQDHLDYHGDMDSYLAAKTKLFKQVGKARKGSPYPKASVVNGDDPRVAEIISASTAPVITYGFGEDVMVRAEALELSQSGTQFRVCYKDETFDVAWPQIGRFYVYNYLAALSVGLLKGLSLEDAVQRLTDFPGVRGRLQAIPNSLGIQVFVDFAHTDDALENVLATLKELKAGRMLTVFGCGGCRDQGKRPKMGAVAEKYSESCFVTSDNPRREEPLAICEEVVRGMRHADKAVIEVDRRAAIQQAIQAAEPGDIVLIAGKGHEAYQVFAHKTVEFDDAAVAQEICEELAKQVLSKEP
jgi:UDP-N-acetylmuramoyl-L-alanyl-D-glutamate--2,6-diaminopimelate ligase